MQMSRSFFLRVVACLGLLLAVPLYVAPSAEAAPPHLERLLEGLWTRVFELPVEQNPFTGGDHCLLLSGPRTSRPVLAPFAPSSPTPPPCTVPFGTELLVTGWSSECSTVEAEPFHGNGEADLRACVNRVDAGLDVPVVTFDGRHVQMKEVETGLMAVLLPEGNVFGAPAGTPMESVGHGWVALVPLAPGQHTVTIHVTGTYAGTVPPGPLDATTTTTINVTR
jgi:hypothetical protein